MAFHNIRFPLELSYGSRGGPGYNTSITELGSGEEERVARWSTPRYRFDIASLVKTPANMYALVQFYHARNGVANSFRFIDWHDYSSGANGTGVPGISDVTLGTGDGTTQDFQLIKVYVSGSESRTRIITKPIHNEAIGVPFNLAASASVRVSLDDVEQVSGWSVNTTTGIVHFDSAPAAGVVVKAGFYFDTPVRFGQELDENFAPISEDFDVESLDSIVLMEERANTIAYEEINYGGVNQLGSLTGNVNITPQEGRVVIFTDTHTPPPTYEIRLPDFTNLATGGPYFFLVNLNGTTNVELRDSTGTVLVTTLTPNRMIYVNLGVDAVGAKIWLPGG